MWQLRCIKLNFGEMKPATDPFTGEVLYEKPRKDRKNSKPKVKMVYSRLLYHGFAEKFCAEPCAVRHSGEGEHEIQRPFNARCIRSL